MSEATTEEFDPVKNIEVWESVTDGTVWVYVKDPRDPQGYRKARVGGSIGGGSRTLRISTDDRRFNQERVVEEMRSHDPFVNGMLRFVSSGPQIDDIDPRYHLADEDLIAMLEVRDQDIFKEAVEEIGSEVVIRRLRAIAERQGTGGQLEIVDNVIDERYRVGHTQKVVREMMDEEAAAAGTILSNT